MKLPDTTSRQRQILYLIYSHRFLNRTQIQALMGHTDKRRISAWLKDLREKEYIRWIYDPSDFYAKTRPAIYYMGINGVRHFLAMGNIRYPTAEVRKRYRESNRSQSYIERSLLIADACINLKQDQTSSDWYTYETEAQYSKGGRFHSLIDHTLIHPHLCFTRDHLVSVAQLPYKSRYSLLEVFDTNYPRYRIARRLKQYIEYLDDYRWDETHTNKPPVILLVCARTSDLIYAKRRTRDIFASQSIQDKETPEDKRLQILFTTNDKLKQHGLLAGIWEQA